MRAALYERYGPGGEVLKVTEVDRPEPGPGEVRVKIALSGVNPTDWKSRSGATPRPIDGFQIPHHDGAGVIDAVGEGVDPGRVGERVWIWMAAGRRRCRSRIRRVLRSPTPTPRRAASAVSIPAG